jgi:hypothetical protein
VYLLSARERGWTNPNDSNKNVFFFIIFVQGTVPRNAVGEMMPVRLATRIAVPDQWETFLVKLSSLKYLQAQEIVVW